jgi:hypothetical protein
VGFSLASVWAAGLDGYPGLIDIVLDKTQRLVGPGESFVCVSLRDVDTLFDVFDSVIVDWFGGDWGPLTAEHFLDVLTCVFFAWEVGFDTQLGGSSVRWLLNRLGGVYAESGDDGKLTLAIPPVLIRAMAARFSESIRPEWFRLCLDISMTRPMASGKVAEGVLLATLGVRFGLLQRWLGLGRQLAQFDPPVVPAGAVPIGMPGWPLVQEQAAGGGATGSGSVPLRGVATPGQNAPLLVPVTKLFGPATCVGLSESAMVDANDLEILVDAGRLAFCRAGSVTKGFYRVDAAPSGNDVRGRLPLFGVLGRTAIELVVELKSPLPGQTMTEEELTKGFTANQACCSENPSGPSPYKPIGGDVLYVPVFVSQGDPAVFAERAQEFGHGIVIGAEDQRLACPPRAWRFQARSADPPGPAMDLRLALRAPSQVDVTRIGGNYKDAASVATVREAFAASPVPAMLGIAWVVGGAGLVDELLMTSAAIAAFLQPPSAVQDSWGMGLIGRWSGVSASATVMGRLLEPDPCGALLIARELAEGHKGDSLSTRQVESLLARLELGRGDNRGNSIGGALRGLCRYVSEERSVEFVERALSLSSSASLAWAAAVLIDLGDSEAATSLIVHFAAAWNKSEIPAEAVGVLASASLTRLIADVQDMVTLHNQIVVINADQSVAALIWLGARPSVIAAAVELAVSRNRRLPYKHLCTVRPRGLDGGTRQKMAHALVTCAGRQQLDADSLEWRRQWLVGAGMESEANQLSMEPLAWSGLRRDDREF